MGRNSIKFEGDIFADLMKKLDEIGGGEAMKRGTEKALIEAKKHTTAKIEKCMVPSNLPAGGKYSTGKTRESINKDMTVKWSGLTAEIPVGFDFSKSGLVSTFLMHGTPKMKAVKGLADAVYGSKTKKEERQIEEQALQQVIKDIVEGK